MNNKMDPKPPAATAIPVFGMMTSDGNGGVVFRRMTKGEQIAHALHLLGEEAHAISVEHGFWEEEHTILDRLCLIHSEVSEAAEEFRKGHEPTKVYYRESDGKPEGIGVELADAVIRCFDLAAYHRIPLNELVVVKMEFNRSRPYKHGKVS